MEAQERKQAWVEDGHGGIPRVELSTNPILRLVFDTEVQNLVGDRLRWLSDEQVEIQENRLSAQEEMQQDKIKRGAIDIALLMVLLVQVPSGLVSFAQSPTVEWEIIAGSFGALCVVKLAASMMRSCFPVVVGAFLANVLLGVLVGEVLHFCWESTQQVIELPYLAGTGVALLFAVSFYVGLFGDISFLLNAKKLRCCAKNLEYGDRVLFTESDVPLTVRDKWWIVWGLSAGSFWAPFHMLYLLCRLTDWVTAALVFGFRSPGKNPR